ncbi:MAG: hypothetical protein ABI204_08060, partial [Ginsengibacter sp.]
SVTQKLTSGKPIVNLKFTGRISSFTLSADADGSNAEISNLVINGHPGATVIVVHENSTQQVFLYEGSFSGDIKGTINFVKTGTKESREPADFLAKVSTDDYIIHGSALFQIMPDTATVIYTHYMVVGGYPRTFDGPITIDESQVTGTFVSYVHLVGTYRGTVNCKRTY